MKLNRLVRRLEGESEPSVEGASGAVTAFGQKTPEAYPGKIHFLRASTSKMRRVGP
jgi:hypothetical protein